ncbi:splicing factor 3a subunit 3 [Pseudovirgaria hyperparasitica]|uniref:Splicing factor 3a subunit 3 n=1 Tax=Pseudovirgaria hyperparasitica TaxID=470096 RepID=A0A6A6VYB8_9PEZI|nr:splicing factor 3a subunit 3 [Pseudovirgaria hyperparasitica]KAF2754816.1 splicing factor 3a subunit 3 [Pseudovirgaria hyperparasitica]
MLLEDQRLAHEDIERLENAIAERLRDEPKHIRDRLARDHQVNGFMNRIQEQSTRLLDIYQDSEGTRAREIQSLSAGDVFESFNKQYNSIKEYHRKYPNEPVENLERSYRRRGPDEATGTMHVDVESLFTGEEGYGRYFDLTMLHEEYLNLPGVKGARRPSYLQYLDIFDTFHPPQCPIKRPEKMTDAYFSYLGTLSQYLEGFMRKTRPLEDLSKLFQSFDQEFEESWKKAELPGWREEPTESTQRGLKTEGTGEGVWCADCEAEFKNENVYKNHMNGKKHKRAAESKKGGTSGASNGTSSSKSNAAVLKVKERAVADREFRIRKLAAAMQTERGDTRVNVERKQGMTDRERAQELAALYAESQEPVGQEDQEGSDDDGEEKIYNPLKLPLAWDGKPIPFWLYKLHGLGVEFPCEICGNFVYMGRRAFDKHFSEARHTWGLKALGITNTTLFREITGIQEALDLWDKLQRDKKQEKTTVENVVQMEDGDGNVMPEKVYYDLQKQGLL